MSPNSRKIASRLAASDHLDSLTGVENRNRFHDHLEHMLQREGGGYVLLTKCNVSRFHHINTSFGYDVGDALLIQVGQRLRTLPDAVIGRLSGDEFAVALPLSDPDLSKETVARIRELLAPMFVLPGATIDVRFSIGYAVGRVRDDSIGLLRKAGIALHELKLSPFPDPIEFDRNAAIRIESRMRLTSDLQQALENSEFLMHYQSKVELATGKIVGAEALLQNRSKHVIVDAMIRLGKELQISVVAEGTETKDEVAVLRKLGCPYAQGYFFGRPMPEAKFIPLLDGKVLSFDQNDAVHRPSGVCAASCSPSAVVVENDPISLATPSEI